MQYGFSRTGIDHDGRNLVARGVGLGAGGFLRKLFYESPYRDAIPPEGVRIIGAYLPDGQALQFVRLSRQVWFEHCRSESLIDLTGTTVSGALSLEESLLGKVADSPSLDLTGAHIENVLSLLDATAEGEVVLRNAKIEGHLVMSGSSFAQKMDGNSLQVGRDLFMNKGTTFKGEVSLVAANIDGGLDMSGSSFAQKVNGNGLQVGQHLFMREGTTFKGEVSLVAANIDGGLDMSGSSFAQTVIGDSLQVGQHLLMREGTTFKGEVILRGAKIGGRLDMRDASFAETVDGNGLQVRQHLVMRDATFDRPTSMVFARIGGSLDLRGATFVGLDLSGTKITQDLTLAGHGSTVTWQARLPDYPALILRNVQVGALQDKPNAWPDSIDLEGFTYGHLGGFGATGTDDARSRSVDEWIAWLAKDGSNSNRYSPRPYAQLASVLAAAGRRDQAHAIQFAGRERERKAAGQQCPFRQWLWLIILVHVYGEREQKTALQQCRFPQWLWLTVLAYVCGYGIGSYTFRVLGWILGSVALGTGVLWFGAPAAHAKGLFWCIGASLDRLLPIVQLNKEFADFFNDPGRTRVAGWVIAVFAGLGLWGWVLGSFLIAALSGLTQKT